MANATDYTPFGGYVKSIEWMMSARPTPCAFLECVVSWCYMGAQCLLPRFGRLLTAVCLGLTLAACDRSLPLPAPTAIVVPVTPTLPTLPPTPTASPLRIHSLQGAGHGSPLVGQRVVDVPGVVTARRADGFYLQDATPDTDPATSDAIFVLTGSPPTVQAGDAVLVTGLVAEARPGAPGGLNNLTTTQIEASAVAVVASGNPLPAPVLIGAAGQRPPTEIIEDDAHGEVGVGDSFDPAQDGLDFWESLEGMRIQLNQAVVVGPRNGFGEVIVLADDGAGAGLHAARGGIVVRPDRFNPQRVFLDDEILKLAGQSMPAAVVGDHFATPLVGVLDYSFGNYKLQLTEPPQLISAGLSREATTAPTPDQISVATFNVQNLDPTDVGRFEALATLVVQNLKSPDIVSVEEIQDNNGKYDDRVVDASRTWLRLIEAVQAAGGPTYTYRQIDPLDDQDGGEPGGNIRQGFLFRTDRGVTFIDRPGGNATTPVALATDERGPYLSASPGRIDPQNPAFQNSRKPLVGEFEVGGQRLFVVGNHLVAKGADQPLFGRYQPPERPSDAPRLAQAQAIARWAADLLTRDPEANLLVVGDLNDFEFSAPLYTLAAAGLTNLTTTLAENDRYSYVFEGNSQTLDHILASSHVMQTMSPQYDIVHLNSEFVTRESDHDPAVVRFTIPRAAAPALTPTPVARATPATPPLIAWRDAGRWIGQTVTAEGVIVASRNTGRVTYLNFSPNYATDLKIVIFPAEAARFPRPPEEMYQGARVRVTGALQEYNGAPQIIVRLPSQIEIVP